MCYTDDPKAPQRHAGSEPNMQGKHNSSCTDSSPCTTCTVTHRPQDEAWRGTHSSTGSHRSGMEFIGIGRCMLQAAPRCCSVKVERIPFSCRAQVQGWFTWTPKGGYNAWSSVLRGPASVNEQVGIAAYAKLQCIHFEQRLSASGGV